MADQVKSIVPGLIEVNSSTLVIGPTGSGKSFLLATAYEYVWEQYKKISLHYNADPGGFPDKLRALAAMGIVRIWRMQSRGMEYSFETAQLAARGYWPAQINPVNGLCPQGVTMIPPVVTTYVETCGKCNQEAGRSIVLQTLLRGSCPHCQTLRSHQTSRIAKLQTVSRGFEDIGTRGYDGLTAISDWYMQDLAHRTELGGEQGSLGGKVNSGGLSWQQNNRAQVGFAQSRAHELIISSLEVPGTVVMPLWTAITEESTDEGGLPIVGPKLAGSAKTDIAPQWFGNVFEARLELDAQQQNRKVRRLYLNSFIDKQNRNHLLRHRGDPRLVPEMVQDAPYDVQGNPPPEIGTQFNLGHVFRILDESLAKTMSDVAVKYPDAPGLKNVPSSYGLDVAPEALQQVQTPIQTGPQVPVGTKPVVAAPRVARAPAKPKTAAQTPAASAAQTPLQEGALSGSAPPAAVTAAPAAASTSPREENVPLPLSPAAAEEPVSADQTPVTTPAPAAAASVPASVETPAADPVPPAVVPHAAAGTPSAPAAGAWAPPPGAARLAPPRAPAAPPKARPISRPVAPSTTKTS